MCSKKYRSVKILETSYRLCLFTENSKLTGQLLKIQSSFTALPLINNIRDIADDVQKSAHPTNSYIIMYIIMLLY